MPTYTQNGLYSAYSTNSTTVATYNTTTQHWDIFDPSHRQIGGSTLVANSPYVIDDWRAWNIGTATTQFIQYPANDTWREWNVYGYSANVQAYQYQYELREPTEEEKKARELAEQKRAKAHRRARSLLESVLTPEQRQYMERHGYIPVIGSQGRKYHVRTGGGASGNVVLVDEKEAVLGRFCVHPRSTHDGHHLPNDDQFLAQVLHLQDDEDDLLKVANLVEGHNPVRPSPLASVA
jgi:hypothetical protein